MNYCNSPNDMIIVTFRVYILVIHSPLTNLGFNHFMPTFTTLPIPNRYVVVGSFVDGAQQGPAILSRKKKPKPRMVNTIIFKKS